MLSEVNQVVSPDSSTGERLEAAFHLALLGVPAAKNADELTFVVIGRVKDLQKLGPAEKSLSNRLPDLGSPKLNWKQNSGVLREQMKRGLPIRDASPGHVPVLNAERNLLRTHGWSFDSRTNLWMPPK